jgi:hypothetical protein
MGVLALFTDDCWESDTAVDLLRDLAGGKPGHALCLRVAGGDVDGASIVPLDARFDELPGEATYLWVLHDGAPLARERLIELYREATAS